MHQSEGSAWAPLRWDKRAQSWFLERDPILDRLPCAGWAVTTPKITSANFRSIYTGVSGPEHDLNIFRRRAVVLKFQNHSMTKQCGCVVVLVELWTCYTGGLPLQIYSTATTLGYPELPGSGVCPKENSWAHLHCRCTSSIFDTGVKCV